MVAIPENDQGLSEFFVGQAAKAVKLPSDTEGDGTGCLIQPLSTVMNAVDRLENAGREIGGGGGIGIDRTVLLLAAQAERREAGHRVSIRLRSAARLLKDYGADAVFPMRSIEVVQQSRQNPSFWSPPEIIIEAVGHQMETLNDCLELVQKRGTVLAFGVPDQPVYAVEYETLFRKNLQVIASVTPVWSEYLVKAREVFLSAREELGKLVTHRFPIREADQAFSLYESHEDGIIKALINMSDW